MVTAGFLVVFIMLFVTLSVNQIAAFGGRTFDQKAIHFLTLLFPVPLHLIDIYIDIYIYLLATPIFPSRIICFVYREAHRLIGLSLYFTFGEASTSSITVRSGLLG